MRDAKTKRHGGRAESHVGGETRRDSLAYLWQTLSSVLPPFCPVVTLSRFRIRPGRSIVANGE